MPYLILDLEMTGNEADYHDIIQIGAVLANDDWKMISEFESLVYPDNQDHSSKYAEEIHGISIDDLQDAPSAYEALENLENWLRKNLRRKPEHSLNDIIVCGQSVINDINFLKQKYSELKILWPFSFKLIDLLSLSFIFYQVFDANGIKRPKSYSLKSVAEFFEGYREDSTHNALEDAKLTFFCFKKYMEICHKLKYIKP